jgi:hypothetical protein
MAARFGSQHRINCPDSNIPAAPTPATSAQKAIGIPAMWRGSVAATKAIIAP